jgi:hypothetical protein
MAYVRRKGVDMVGVMAGGTMAKAKAKRGRPTAKDKTAKTLGYRVTPDYLAWITKAARVNRSSISGLIDQAVAKYAQDIGVPEPAPDRTA